jgi:hypothetical protein
MPYQADQEKKDHQYVKAQAQRIPEHAVKLQNPCNKIFFNKPDSGKY